MKKVLIFFCLIFIFLAALDSENQQKIFPVLKGPYLGQKPPGIVPELFVPEIFTKSKPAWAFCVVFHPGGKDLYYVSDNGIKHMEQIVYLNMLYDIWTPPRVAYFNSDYPSNNFCFSTDGEMIFFRSWRPLPGHEHQKGISSLWFSKHGMNGWEKAQPIKCGQKFVRRVGQPSVHQRRKWRSTPFPRCCRPMGWLISLSSFPITIDRASASKSQRKVRGC